MFGESKTFSFSAYIAYDRKGEIHTEREISENIESWTTVKTCFSNQI